MSASNKSKISVPRKANTNKSNKESADFSQVGGLSHHISTLRDLIIFPLLYGNVYSHFKIKAPRGVLFYGPPGTGKTLVAGALATEMSKDGSGKVSFFQRKGADVLDKWVGESEKKLRDLFDKAAKSRPAVIFFDELDGLAPVRSQKNDHVHCSVVATLLALMDGLDSMPGVIVIGATNRLESVDPALRRPGRFDKELYFPLPATDARREILQVHTQSWKHKPSPQFVNHLAEITSGFCGSDLQALCADAVLCCVKRVYPNMQKTIGDGKVNINLENLKVEDCDFLCARQNMVSSSLKTGSKRRKLSAIVRPLLERQLNKVLNHLNLVWPHYRQKDYKYLVGNERYAGRIILFGSNKQGLNTHLMPAILQSLEHLPAYILDIPSIFDKNFNSVTSNLPSVLVLSRVDEWWNLVENGAQMSLASALEEIHAGLPILAIATSKNEIPTELHDFFYSNCSIPITVEDPNQEERAEFFAPIFFSDKQQSMQRVLMNLRSSCVPLLENIKGEPETSRHSVSDKSRKKSRNSRLRGGGGMAYEQIFRLRGGGIGRFRARRDSFLRLPRLDEATSSSRMFPGSNGRSSTQFSRNDDALTCCTTCGNFQRKKYFTTILADLIGRRSRIGSCYTSLVCDKPIKTEPKSETSLLRQNGINPHGDPNGAFAQHTISETLLFTPRRTDSERVRIYNLWRRTYQRTSMNMPVAELELLYDAIATCISMYSFSFKTLCEVCVEQRTISWEGMQHVQQVQQ